MSFSPKALPTKSHVTRELADLERQVEQQVLDCASGATLSDKVGDKFDTPQKFHILLGCIQAGLRPSVPGLDLRSVSAEKAAKLQAGSYLELAMWVLVKIATRRARALSQTAPIAPAAPAPAGGGQP